MTRRFLKWAVALPAFVALGVRGLTARLGAATSGGSSIDVYRRLGVRPFINARGTWTHLSGSLQLPEVRWAMDAASQHFVDILELQEAAGRKLAELSGAEPILNPEPRSALTGAKQCGKNAPGMLTAA